MGACAPRVKNAARAPPPRPRAPRKGSGLPFPHRHPRSQTATFSRRGGRPRRGGVRGELSRRFECVARVRGGFLGTPHTPASRAHRRRSLGSRRGPPARRGRSLSEAAPGPPPRPVKRPRPRDRPRRARTDLRSRSLSFTALVAGEGDLGKSAKLICNLGRRIGWGGAWVLGGRRPSLGAGSRQGGVRARSGGAPGACAVARPRAPPRRPPRQRGPPPSRPLPARARRSSRGARAHTHRTPTDADPGNPTV